MFNRTNILPTCDAYCVMHFHIHVLHGSSLHITFAERYPNLPKRLRQFQPSGNVLGRFCTMYHVIYTFNIVAHNMKQPGIYKIKDGLHELGVMGKNQRSNIL